ncbi:hypothetical protein H4219_001569 [Mycoemilia scoparia]|uniref:Uncharacterized protein n=1 Tax=Mycoemilia scoparia TaxID=417184 RepID=A0A9W7ZZT9_9FUNG|nr:hypothetical protein H4219_001569 [Mycoemilia scoparia]
MRFFDICWALVPFVAKALGVAATAAMSSEPALFNRSPVEVNAKDSPFTISQGNRVLEVAGCGPCPDPSVCKKGDCWVLIPPMVRQHKLAECDEETTTNCYTAETPKPVNNALELNELIDLIVSLENEKASQTGFQPDATITVFPASQ